MERVLDVYERPYNADYNVVCMDESPKQLVEEARPSTAMKPGQETRVDYEYIRHGGVNIFTASEPLQGNRLVEVTEFKTKKDWVLFVKKIADDQYPEAKKITLVMENLKTYSPSSFYETFEPEQAKELWDRFEFIFTPKHWSWFNMAEIELHVSNGQCLNRYISTKVKVEKEVDAWQSHRNNKHSKINWKFTCKDARIKLKRLYSLFQN